MGFAKIKALAGVGILLTTLGFGLYPFNFFSRNDVAFDPATPGLRFHPNAHKKGYSQQAVAYTTEPIHLRANQPVTILIEAVPSKIPGGLGTLVEIHDGLEQPPLIVAQWINHLVIRSRRLDPKSGRAYQEIGLKDCLPIGKLSSLIINYDGSATRIYYNGKLSAVRRGYHLLDRDYPLNAFITIGNNATGERGWIGTLKRIAIFEESTLPDGNSNADNDPIIEYNFNRPAFESVPNQSGPKHDLRIPTRFKPLKPKSFAALSSFSEREDWQSSDITINFFGFIPSSIVMFLIIRRRTNLHWLLPIATGLGAFTLRLAIEYLQIALPSRSPSYVDLSVNTLAGLLTGFFLLVMTWKQGSNRASKRLILPTD